MVSHFDGDDDLEGGRLLWSPPEHGFAFKTETGDVLNGTEATGITSSTFVWHLSGVDFGLLFLFLLYDLSFPCGLGTFGQRL